MLTELAVTDLGVIESTRLVLGGGMTALTGETGAGKTMLVGAIELLVGGRADPLLVRHGAKEATVEGRFVVGDEELVLTRVVPVNGRSRAYIDGRMATAAALAEAGGRVVDLHGQHDHQSLLAAAVQRDALDRFAAIDLGPLLAARASVTAIDRRLAELGGDAGARAREIDLLRYQSVELYEAALEDPVEDERLDAEESLLGDAIAHREAGAAALAALSVDDGAQDRLAAAIAALGGRAPYADDEVRLRAVAAELADIARSVRDRSEAIVDDPARLDVVRERRQRLHDLRRKYGTAAADPDSSTGNSGGGTLADVIAYRDQVGARLAALEAYEERAAALEGERAAEVAIVRREEQRIGKERRVAAPALAAAVQSHLSDLAMASARIAVEVDDVDPGDGVRFLLAANAGSLPLPLAKVASGGELARTMLALRLVLSAAPPCLVFDEVDAGIGGAAALAVGRSLAALGADHQVLVVTHLPQVAAFADAQVTVVKSEGRGATSARAQPLDTDQRIVELSRMLSGTPESAATQDAAAELLATAAAERGR